MYVAWACFRNGMGNTQVESMVDSKLNLRILPARRRPQGKKAPKRLDISKLNQDSMKQAFFDDICSHLDVGAMNPVQKTQKKTGHFSKGGSFFSCNYLRTSISLTPNSYMEGSVGATIKYRKLSEQKNNNT